jgi:hypothetical protein
MKSMKSHLRTLAITSALMGSVGSNAQSGRPAKRDWRIEIWKGGQARYVSSAELKHWRACGWKTNTELYKLSCKRSKYVRA